MRRVGWSNADPARILDAEEHRMSCPHRLDAAHARSFRYRPVPRSRSRGVHSERSEHANRHIVAAGTTPGDVLQP
jgi:hypothetical protein